MKKPKSSGDGTTGAWNIFSEAVNKIGDKEAGKRRDRLEKKKLSLFDRKNKKNNKKN